MKRTLCIILTLICAVLLGTASYAQSMQMDIYYADKVIADNIDIELSQSTSYHSTTQGYENTLVPILPLTEAANITYYSDEPDTFGILSQEFDFKFTLGSTVVTSGQETISAAVAPTQSNGQFMVSLADINTLLGIEYNVYTKAYAIVFDIAENIIEYMPLYDTYGACVSVPEYLVATYKNCGYTESFTDGAMTVYNANGETKIINKSQYYENNALGWYNEAIITMYAPDGRSKSVFASNVEAEKSVGWYTVPVCKVYAADGRSKVIPITRVEIEKTVGWFDNLDDVQVTMYAPDGRNKKVFKARVAAEQSVGWYTEPVCKMYAADGRVKIALVSRVEDELKVGWFLTKADAVFSKFPTQNIKVLNIYFGRNESGGVEPCICWRNDSGKTIDYITFEIDPIDKAGKPAPCTKTNVGTKFLRVSQDVETFNRDNVKQGYFCKDGVLKLVTKDESGKFGFDIFDENNKLTGRYTLTAKDENELINNIHFWNALWYNDNIHDIVIKTIRVKYVDETFESISDPIIWKDIYESM